MYEVFCKANKQFFTMYKIVSFKVLNENRIVVTYIPFIYYDIVKSHNLDFVTVVKKYSDHEIQARDATSISISADVTAYGRIHITKIKLDILKRGGNIYYSDTDSIITYLKLDNSMVNSKELGKLKL